MANRQNPKQKPPPGAVMNGAHPLSQGLVGWWLFNENGGTKAYDISGRNNTGTLTGGPTWKSGKFGQALDFVDGNRAVTISGAAPTLAKATISMWVKPVDVVSNRQFAGTFNPGWLFRTEGGGDFGFYNGTDGDFGTATNPMLSLDGIWQYVTVTYDGDKYRLYHNGVIQYTSSGGRGGIVTGSTVYIGNYSGLNAGWNGLIDDFRIYNRALSAQEVRMLYETPYANIARVKRRMISVNTASTGNFFRVF